LRYLLQQMHPMGILVVHWLYFNSQLIEIPFATGSIFAVFSS